MWPEMVSLGTWEGDYGLTSSVIDLHVLRIAGSFAADYPGRFGNERAGAAGCGANCWDLGAAGHELQERAICARVPSTPTTTR